MKCTTGVEFRDGIDRHSRPDERHDRPRYPERDQGSPVSDDPDDVAEHVQTMGEWVLLVAVRDVIRDPDGDFRDGQSPPGEVGEHVGLDVVALGIKIEVGERTAAEHAEPRLGVRAGDAGADLRGEVEGFLAEDAVFRDPVRAVEEA